MQLDEAMAVQDYIRRGIPVQSSKARESRRVISTAAATEQGEHHDWVPEPISTAQRDRINKVLAYNLAQACHMFDAWSTT